MDSVLVVLQLLLAAVFAVAGVAKLFDLSGARSALYDFGVTPRLVPVGAVLLPLVEVGTAVALVFPPTARWGAAVALLLLAGFMVGIARALAQGRAPDCHCFGQVHSAPAGSGTLVRNGVLAVFALVVLIFGPAPAVDEWTADWSAAELVAFGLGALAAGLAGYSVRLWRRNKTLERELAREREFAALFPPGLPVGATGPSFDLPSLGGERLALHELLERGRPVALVFASATCGPCATLLPEVGRWQGSVSDRLTIAVLSSGDAQTNSHLFDYGVSNVGLQADAEVMEAYRPSATPSAVILAADGSVATAGANGAPAVELLVRLALRDGLTHKQSSYEANGGVARRRTVTG